MHIIIITISYTLILLYTDSLYIIYTILHILLHYMLGVWKELKDNPGNSVPVSGLAYYISPPTTLAEVYADPIHVIFYLLFILASCALFSKTWIEVSGSSPKDVAKQLRDQQIVLKGHRNGSLVHELTRYIPAAAAFGGMYSIV